MTMVGVRPKRSAERKKYKSVGAIQLKIMEVLHDEPWTTIKELVEDHDLSVKINHFMVSTTVAGLAKRGFILDQSGSLKLTENGEKYLKLIRSGDVKVYHDRQSSEKSSAGGTPIIGDGE